MSTNLKYFNVWEKQGLAKFIAPNGQEIYLVTEHNPSYGYLIKRFQIDSTNETEVKNKCLPDRFIRFAESGSLCGEREFEKGSITYEYLLKPFGIDVEGYPATGKDGWDVLHTSYYTFKQRFLALGGKVVI